MDALICPNCGASLPEPAVNGDVVTCQYCSTTFRIPKTFTPEPALGDLILGADFSAQPLAGWTLLHEENTRLIPGPTPELRAKFGADDGLIPPADVDALEATLAAHGKDFVIRRYAGAGHAFYNDTRPDAFRPDAAADAFPRAVAFLHRHLDG